MARFIEFPTDLLEIAQELEEHPEVVQAIEEIMAMTPSEETPTNTCPADPLPESESPDAP